MANAIGHEPTGAVEEARTGEQLVGGIHGPGPGDLLTEERRRNRRKLGSGPHGAILTEDGAPGGSVSL